MIDRPYEYQSDFARKHFGAGKLEGKLKARADALLTLMTLGGLTPSAEQQSEVRACGDIDQLERWFVLAVTADSADDVFRG